MLLHILRGCLRSNLNLDKYVVAQSLIARHKHTTMSSILKNEKGDGSSLEEAKCLAASSAVDAWVNEDIKVVGIGSGSTVVYAVRRLAERISADPLLADIVCVPTSFQARQLILENNLNLGDLDRFPNIDLTIDGADEVDDSMTLIKGGGGCLLQEKIVAYNSNILIIVADHTKKSSRLGEQWCKGVPIEVVPSAWVPIKKRIKALFDGELVLRMAKMKAGPLVTDNGNFILDWIFLPRREYNWDSVNKKIKMIPGVVETGLFVGMASKIYFGLADGSVKVQSL